MEVKITGFNPYVYRLVEVIEVRKIINTAIDSYVGKVDYYPIVYNTEYNEYCAISTKGIDYLDIGNKLFRYDNLDRVKKELNNYIIFKAYKVYDYDYESGRVITNAYEVSLL